MWAWTASYLVHFFGVAKDVQIVDTTGAGDSFIGGYLMARLLSSSASFCVHFASWVAGQKLQGSGARSSLPTGNDLDRKLGTSLFKIESTLAGLISEYDHLKNH